MEEVVDKPVEVEAASVPPMSQYEALPQPPIVVVSCSCVSLLESRLAGELARGRFPVTVQR